MIKQKKFDAIVVGSGITGGWAAKELCERGLKTLVLERGRDMQHVASYKTATKAPWEFEHRGMPTIKDREEYPIQSQVYCFSEATKHLWVKDIEHPYSTPKDQIFHWVRGYHLGGRSITWGRQCYRLSDLDFTANLEDGHGVDWPIRYDDIAPWYSYVERFIGVSGSKENIPVIPDGEFLPAMEMTAVEKYFKAELEQHWLDRKMIIGRAANLTQDINGRNRCQHRDLCYRGCPLGAYFSSLSATLPAAQKTGNLSIKTNAVAEQVIYDPTKNRAKGVRILDAHTGELSEVFADVIFLCASTLGTTWLLLNSANSLFDKGLANSSGMLGKNLMDHHNQVGASGEIDKFNDRYYFGGRPNEIYIPRFRNIKKDKQKYLRGFGYQGSGVRKSWSRGGEMVGIGEDFKMSLTYPGAWSMRLLGFGECLPNEKNAVYLNHDKKDIHGLPTLMIDAKHRDNEINMRKDMHDQATQMLEVAGFKNIKSFNKDPIMGYCIHEMGTARMGRDPKTSVLNKWNQSHDIPNLFITDGSCMTSSGCQNPSLTYMALTARAVNYAVRELKKRNI